MPCFSPLEGRRLEDGTIKFRAKGHLDVSPLKVSCGQCIGCRLERSRQWAVRCMHEAQMHEYNSFLTLTYTDEELPPNGTLVLADWQQFAKKLRQHLFREWKKDNTHPKTFRFYHCGEYGEETYRPHYHALIFGLDFGGDRKHFKNSGDHPLYRSALLDRIWGHGFVNIGELNFHTAAYVARYAMKKITGEAGKKHYTRVNTETGEVTPIKPPYATMSRNPGIGSTWLDKFQTDVYPSDEVIVNGHPSNPPSYYDYQLGKTQPELLAQIKEQRIKDADLFKDNQTYERLEIREHITKQRTQHTRNQNQ